MYLDHDDAYQLMKEEEADARDAALASPLGRAIGGPVPSIVDALNLYGAWHADVPFDGSHGDRKLDLALADAFRMAVYLREPRAQMKWIERELFAPRFLGLPCTPYQRVLIRWWLAIYDNEQRSRRHG